MTDFFKPLQKDRPLRDQPNWAKYDKKNKGLNSFLTNLYLTYFSVSQKGIPQYGKKK